MSTFFSNKQTSRISAETTHVSFVLSQLILFQSRKKNGMVYAIATIAGLFCIPGGLVNMLYEVETLQVLQRILPLPAISLLVALGMYILNDLTDIDLDRVNNKKRPIPSGQVSKEQVYSFVILTNGAAILLAMITSNLASMIIIVPMIVMGILYSAPKIAFKDRFVIKTLSIAFGIILCFMLGATAGFGLNGLPNSFAIPIYGSVILGMMIFVTSPFNDIGDIAGDRAAGRRTIPIVIGAKNTVKMAMLFAMSISATSWTLYGLSVVGLIMAASVSFVSALTIVTVAKTLRKLDDAEFVRRQHKKAFPLHIMLQSALMAGTLLL